MKIAITGGAGFIGSHLATAYIDAGHDVVIIDSLVHGLDKTLDPRARFYHSDIRDEKFRTILQMERPDVVSHHVGQREAYDSLLPHEALLADADVDIRGLLHVLENCVSASVSKFIFASNGNSLYGDVSTDQLPMKEDMPFRLHRSRDISKITGEQYVRYYTQHYGLAHTILRYAEIYGETHHRQLQHPLSHFIYAVSKQQRPIIRGTGNGLRDHIFIDDVVEANVLTLKRGQNQTLHISSGHGYTLNQLYRMVAHYTNSDKEPIYLSRTHTQETSVILDNQRAQQALNWSPKVDIFDGVELAMARLLPKALPTGPREAAEAFSDRAVLAVV